MSIEESGRKHRVSVAHALGLNDLQLSLIRARVLDTWKPEPMIRFENQYLANPNAKDYDAIVTVRIDDRESVFNLEYERTAKRYRDYADIRDLLEQIPNLDPVLYVVPDFELLRVLRHAFDQTIAPVHVCLAGDFNDSFMDMEGNGRQFRGYPIRCGYSLTQPLIAIAVVGGLETVRAEDLRS
jgi:hypothetical protein